MQMQDQSATASAATGYFNPTFGNVSLPGQINIETVVVVSIVAIVGLVVWKKL